MHLSAPDIQTHVSGSALGGYVVLLWCISDLRRAVEQDRVFF